MNTQGTLIPKAVFLYGTMLYHLSCSTFPGPPLIDIYTPLATEPPHDSVVNEVHENLNGEAPLLSSNSSQTGKAKVCLKAFPLTTHSQVDQYFPALCPKELEYHHRIPPHTVSPAAVPHEAHRCVSWKSALVFLPSKPSYSGQTANFLFLFNCSGSSPQYSIFPSSFLLKILVDLSIYIYISIYICVCIYIYLYIHIYLYIYIGQVGLSRKIILYFLMKFLYFHKKV